MAWLERTICLLIRIFKSPKIHHCLLLLLVLALKNSFSNHSWIIKNPTKAIPAGASALDGCDCAGMHFILCDVNLLRGCLISVYHWKSLSCSAVLHY